MKEKILATLKEALYLCDNEPELAEEITSLKEQIDYMQREIWRERNAKYVAQLEEFEKHMHSCFEILMGDESTDGTVENFYTSEFEIHWRGRSVKLYNGAEVFQGIEEIVQNEIKEYKEN